MKDEQLTAMLSQLGQMDKKNMGKGFANIAMASGNPYLMGAGAVYNLASMVTGNFGKDAKQKRDTNMLASRMAQEDLLKRSSAIIGQFPTSGLGGVYRAYGGPIGKGKMYMTGGAVIPVSDTGGLLVGNTHEQGGIQMPGVGEVEGGETITTMGGTQPFIATDRMINPSTGNTFADDIAKLEKAKGKIENNKSHDTDRFKQNGISVMQEKIDMLLQKQEAVKSMIASSMQESQPQQFAYGGPTNPLLKAGNNAMTLPTLQSKYGRFNLLSVVQPDSYQIGNDNMDFSKTKIKGMNKLDIFDSLPMNTIAQLGANSMYDTPRAPIQEKYLTLPKVSDDSSLVEINKAGLGAMNRVGSSSGSLANMALVGNIAANIGREKGMAKERVANVNADIIRQQELANSQIGARNIGNLNLFQDEQVKFNNQKIANVLGAMERDKSIRQLNKNAREEYKTRSKQTQADMISNLVTEDPRTLEYLGLSLDEEERKKMFSELFKAIGLGKIKTK